MQTSRAELPFLWVDFLVAQKTLDTSFKKTLITVILNTHHKTSILEIDGVESKEETPFYLGKKVAYIYKAQTKKAGPNGPTKFRCVWGKITRAHGSGGSVRATFRKPLPTKSLGAKCRVMLYPSQI